MAPREMRELGPTELKALTHPIRVQMLRALRADGPATATLLAKRFGESTGVTSYHLRQLERHGFVEEVPHGGKGRERWWRALFVGHHVATERWLDDPEAAAVVTMYESAVIAEYARAAAEWATTQGDWPREWVEASVLNDYRLRLPPHRLKQLTAAVEEIVAAFDDEYEAHEDVGDEQVVVVFQAFPRRPRPFVEEEA